MSDARDIRNLAMIGFMGTGKSSTGQIVAAQLKRRFVDTDEMIEARAGKPITQIFADDGEEGFRKLEAEIVDELTRMDDVIISTGGGLAANDANLASLKSHALVACLWASPEAIWQRVGHQSHRPLLECDDPQGRIRDLLAQREPYYRQADVLLNTEMRSVKDVAQQLAYHFHEAQKGQQTP